MILQRAGQSCSQRNVRDEIGEMAVLERSSCVWSSEIFLEESDFEERGIEPKVMRGESNMIQADDPNGKGRAALFKSHQSLVCLSSHWSVGGELVHMGREVDVRVELTLH